MFRKIKRAGITRTACFALAGSLAWLAGPCQLAQAATLKTPAEVARAAGQARLLNETERRAIRGSATWPGTPRPWQYSVPTLGGYGVVNCFSGNHQISIPVVAYGGKGIPTAFALYHNSAATTQAPPAYPGGSSGMQAAPPIANGWRHSYHVLLEGAGTTTVTVVEGDGTRNSFTQNVNGSFTAPAGVWDTLVRNVNLTYTLTRKGGLKVNFGTNNRLASLVDLNGNTTSVAYGANGEVSTVTDAAGRVLTLAYNASKQLTTITDPASRVFTLTYSNNLLQRVTFPAPATGAAQPYFEFVTDSTYASITSFRNRRGSVWSLSWGNSGGDMQCFGGMTDPATKTVSMNWGMRQVTRENGAIYTWTSDAGGNRASVQLCPDVYHMMAETQSWTWDSQRNLLTEVKGSGNTWTYTYDSRGNQLTVEDPITAADPNVVKQTTTYNSLDLPASSTDALGHTTSYTYDVKGNLTKVVDPLLHETTHTYSTAGQRLTTTDPRLKVWETVYDTTGNATQQKDPLLNTTTTAYTTLGWPTTVTDPTGVQNTTSYDNLGRVSRVTHVADSSYVEKTYDGEDAVLTERDENARVTTNAYHAMGWLSSTTDAKSQVTSFAYNPMGQRTSLTNARNKTTTWTLDNGGRAVKTTYPDATTEESTYNANGDVATRKDGRGNIVTSGYDTVGRLTNMTYPTGTGTSFTYLANDARSTLTDRTGTTTWTYNARGETTQVNAPQGTITTGYDAARNRTSVSRTGGISLTYVYDNASRLASQGNGYGETTSYTLDAAGRITQQVQGNGTKVLSTYATGSTGRGWLTVLEHRQSTNAVLARYEYTRGLTGHTTIATQPGNHSVTYTYDNVYQLTAEVRTGSSPYSYSYSYDATSNRLTKVSGGVTTTSTYGDNNQILTSGGKTYSHDADGNMTGVTSGGTTTTLAWDYNQKLTGITYPGGATNSFVTNDLGNRVSKVDSGGTTTSLYDGSSVLADSRADYTQGGVTGLISERASGTSKYYHGDQLGSTRGITSAAQSVIDSREYDSFGLLIATTGTTATPFGFVGGQGYRSDSQSGLQLLGARYYDPSIGRFISRDPIGYEGGLNLYGYCGNDPVNASDPSGLDWLDNTSNFAAGWGDTLTFGGTGQIRSWVGAGSIVEYNSGAYGIGQGFGVAHGTALAGATAYAAAMAAWVRAGGATMQVMVGRGMPYGVHIVYGTGGTLMSGVGERFGRMAVEAWRMPAIMWRPWFTVSLPIRYPDAVTQSGQACHNCGNAMLQAFYRGWSQRR